MKLLLKFSHLLLIVVCAAPLLANASTINISQRGYQQGFQKVQSQSQGYRRGKAQQPHAFKELQVHNQSQGQGQDQYCCGNGELGLLVPATNANNNLGQGSYLFGQAESSFNGSFADRWTFSLAENSQVSLSLLDLDLGSKFSRLLGTSKVGLELFDSSNSSLGSISNNLSLNLLLAANSQYSFVVSGVAGGIFGGFYLGKLDACPVAVVPIGGAFPMFAAALLLLSRRIRLRSRQY